MSGVNWYGFETNDELAGGLWAQDYHTILNTIKTNGYNVVRIPFSNQMVETPIVPSNVSFNNGSAINTDLKGLNSLQILDKIVAEAGVLGLHVILDNHRSEAGSSAEASGLWYTSAYPEANWIADWTMLTNRYLNNSTVIGLDLRNEPHNATSGGACWGCGGANDWRLAAERAGNAVLAINPKLLMFVEGTDCVNNDCDWWGGNLEAAESYPVTFNVSGQLVYSAHDYGPNLYVQNWFNGSTTYASLVSTWTKYWAYLSLNGVAPVWVGEFGTTDNSSDIENSAAGSQGQWFESMVAFLKANPQLNWTYWALNGEDTYGLLDSNYDAVPPSALKQQLLASIQFTGSSSGGSSGGTCKSDAPVPSGLTATATAASQINLSWAAVTAPQYCSVTYNVYASTASGFTPSASNRIATGAGGTTYSATGLQGSTKYYFVVTSVDADGESSASGSASATTPAATCSSVPATAPSSLTATPASTTQINLSWGAVAAPSNCSVAYNIYSSTTSGFTPSSSNRIATGVSGTSQQVTGLKASTAYYFIVRAADAVGEGSSSSQAAATTLSASGGSGVSCHVSYTVYSQWNNGFNTGITIQNTGSSSISSWTLTWTWPANEQIYQSWNGNYTQNGASTAIANASWNGSIAAGGSQSGIGFNASYSGSNPTPAAFYLNGTLCH